MKSTKKSLALSALSLFLCVSMLIGTTFAWFTDSVTSGRNTITAGNLDVELTHNNGSGDKPVQDATDLFSIGLWEPGKVVYENFTVKNVGNLALKYTMVLSRWNFNTVKDTDKSLADVIKVAVVPGGYTATTREALLADTSITFDSLITEGTNDLYKIDFDEASGKGILYPTNSTPAGGKTSDTFGVILYWEPSDIDNDYNLNNGKKSSDGEPLFIEFGANLIATQYTYEADSFDDQYDKDTTLPEIGTKTQSSKKAANGTYTFENDTYVEEGETKQAPSTVIPAETKFYSSHDKSEGSKVEEATGDNVTGELNRKVETSKEFDDDTKETVIDLDISFTYTTKTNGEVTGTQDVKAFSNVIEYCAPIGKYAIKKVTHNGVPMTKAANMTAKVDQTYYYDSAAGMLYVWSSTYSVFEAVGVDCVAFIERDGNILAYNTLIAALNAQEDGETVVLVKTVTGSDTTWQKLAKGTYTLDLNGNNIIGPEKDFSRPTLQINAKEGSNVKITDSSDKPGAIINYRNTPPEGGGSDHIHGALYIHGYPNYTTYVNVVIENISIINKAGQSAITNNSACNKESLVIKSGKIEGDIYLDLSSGGDVIVSVYDDVEYTGTTKFIADTKAHKVDCTDKGDYVTYRTVVDRSISDLYLTEPTASGSEENTWTMPGAREFTFTMGDSATKYRNVTVEHDIDGTTNFAFTLGNGVLNATFDLNGKTLTGNPSWRSTFKGYTSGGTDTITIVDPVGTGKIVMTGGYASTYVDKVKLIIEGGTYELVKFEFANKGSVVIKAGTFTVPAGYVDTLKSFVTSGCTVTINGASYTAE